LQSPDQLIDALNVAALNSGLKHATRGVSPATRRAADHVECRAAFALQQRFAAIRACAERLGDPELLALVHDGQQA
jgi:hypothetical protein